MTLWEAAFPKSHHLTKFGANRFSGRGDKNFLVCLVISRCHVINGACDICEPLTGPSSHHLFAFGCHWYSGRRDTTYLICHVTSQDYVIEGSCDFMVGSYLWYFTKVASFVVIEIVVVET